MTDDQEKKQAINAITDQALLSAVIEAILLDAANHPRT
jgi:hypothetical protein